MKRNLAVVALLFLVAPAYADYTDCEQYIDVHETERVAFDAQFGSYDAKVLEPLRRKIANLDQELGETATWEKRLRKLQKKNRGYEGDNNGAQKKQAKANSKIQSNQQLIAEKRRQVEDADNQGNSKRANKLRNEISKLTKKTGKLQAAIAERKVKIANREKKISANAAEIAELERALDRSGTKRLLESRRRLDKQLQQQNDIYAQALRTVDVLHAAIDLCEAYAAQRAD